MEIKERVIEFLTSYGPKEVLLYAHADHDGICAAAGLTHLFGDFEVKFSQSFRPREMPLFYGKKVFVICDLQLTKNQILSVLSRGIKVVNLDHHDVVEIENDSYLCVNPKKIYGEEFVSSSGLVWRLFHPSDISWVLGVGSAGDIAVEGVLDLFENLEGLRSRDLKKIYSSKFFEMAQILLMSFFEPGRGYALVKKAIVEGVDVFYDSLLYRDYLKKKDFIEGFFEEENERILTEKKFVFIDSSGKEYRGSYSVFLNVRNKDERVYVEYSDGRIFFRNFFGNDSASELARFFGGGGSHKRTGAAFTRKSARDVFESVKKFFTEKQKTIFDFG